MPSRSTAGASAESRELILEHKVQLLQTQLQEKELELEQAETDHGLAVSSLFEQMHEKEIVDLRILPSVSMEATAKHVFEYADGLVREATGGRCWVAKVMVAENDKNSAEYELVERRATTPPTVEANSEPADADD